MLLKSKQRVFLCLQSCIVVSVLGLPRTLINTYIKEIIMLIQIDLQNNLKAVGAKFNLEQNAKVTTGCARMALAMQMNADDSTIKEQQIAIAKACKLVYKKAYGKVKDEVQVKGLNQCRQVVATMKRAEIMKLTPDTYATYASFRTDVYDTTPLSKLELLAKWIADDKETTVTLAMVTALVAKLAKAKK